MLLFDFSSHKMLNRKIFLIFLIAIILGSSADGNSYKPSSVTQKDYVILRSFNSPPWGQGNPSLVANRGYYDINKITKAEYLIIDVYTTIYRYEFEYLINSSKCKDASRKGTLCYGCCCEFKIICRAEISKLHKNSVISYKVLKFDVLSPKPR